MDANNKKKYEYLLKRHYRTCHHTKLHSIMGCEKSALTT